MIDGLALKDDEQIARIVNSLAPFTLGLNAHHCNIIAQRAGSPAPPPRLRELTRNMRPLW